MRDAGLLILHPAGLDLLHTLYGTFIVVPCIVLMGVVSIILPGYVRYGPFTLATPIASSSPGLPVLYLVSPASSFRMYVP